MLEDTIAAIATPLGESGIGIVRISGEKAIELARKVFIPAKKKEWWRDSGYRLVYGHVVDPETNEVIDEVLLGLMRGPHSFTREDVVELNCHGGVVPLRKTLETVLRHGARLAEPGEFSRRAFLNGRIDLAQAEAIIDLVRARTDAQLKMAVSQLKGKLSEKIMFFQDQITDLLAMCEAVIDFPEDVEETPRSELEESLSSLIKEVDSLIASAEKGKIYREGAFVVIAGRPNVGKSSLLNTLLRERRAIVTEIPGTTRDVIEEVVNIKGVPVRLADTAGLRSTTDPVEIIGVEKAKELLDLADLVLVLIDAAAGLTGEDRKILAQVERKNTVYLVNKVDLADGEEVKKHLQEMAGGRPVLKISALTGEGIEALEEVIFEQVIGAPAIATDSLLVNNVRHKNALEKARRCLAEALEGVRAGLPEDLLVIDLREAWEALGEITGSTVAEDIIDRIFANFCIGK
ncbi:MAG: tRNA uridine-5-carboxymethylaminomethyl(34) synthesis GTPase MnmE [Armatimonadetes bacterium]|nr:tRNA uridine-5-carboxymethylaminomethyl(34) synthesis GTPase MnmE [Armatimonadota bacterium]